MKKRTDFRKLLLVIGWWMLAAFVAMGQTATISGNSTICIGASTDLSIILTGTQPWSITYTDGITPVTVNNITSSPYTISVSPASTRTYTLTAFSDANGPGTTSGSAIVTVNALPVPTISGTNSLCQGSTGNVYTTQSGKTNYTWAITGGTITAGGTASSSTATVTWNTAGTGTISVNYTSNGCSAVDPYVYNVTVNPVPLPTVISGPTNVCVGSTGNVYATQTGMTNYSWTVSTGGTPTSSTGSTVTVTWNTASSGNNRFVNVTYRAAGCPGTSANYVVTVNALPTPTAGSNSPVCEGSALNLTSTVGASYSWTGPNGFTSTQQNPSISNATLAATGTYTVTVTNAAGCSAPATTPVTINASVTPAVSIAAAPSGSICTGTSVTFTATSLNGGSTPTYQWKRNGSNVGTGVTYTTSTLADNDQITCVMTSNAQCAVNPANSNVIVMNVNPLPTITGTTPNDRCGTGTVALGATASAGTVNWYTASSGGSSISTGNTYTTPSISAPTTYYVDATASGCTTASRTAVIATVNPLPTVSISGPASACAGSSGNIYTTQGSMSNYTWSITGGTITAGGGGNNSTATVTWNTAGSISVNYTNSSGCSAAVPTVYNVTLVGALVAPVICCDEVVCSVSTADPLTITSPPSGGSGTYTRDWQMSANGTSGWTSTGGTGPTYIPGTLNQYYRLLIADASCGTIPSNVVNITSSTSYSFGISGSGYPSSAVCGETGFTLHMSSLSIQLGTNRYIRYSWTVDNSTYITPASGGPVGTSNPVFPPFVYTYTADIPFTVHNPTSSPVVAHIYLSPIVYNFNGSPYCNLTQQTYTITISAAPATPGAISGSTSVCSNTSGLTYSISAVSGATSYTWTKPAGWTGTSTGTSITLSAGAGAVSGNITVAANGCGTSAPSTLAVTVSTAPAAPTASVTVQPTCAVPTGTIVVTAPLGATIEYNIDGGAYQSSVTFAGVSGCT